MQGEVFIVTKGGQNYKLGLVSVRAYDVHAIESLLADRQREVTKTLHDLAPEIARAEQIAKIESDLEQIDLGLYRDRHQPAEVHEKYRVSWSDQLKKSQAASAKLQELRNERQRLASGAPFLESLPPPLKMALTNADGKFSLTIPTSAELAVVADGKRMVDGTTEEYYWFVRVPTAEDAGSVVMLSNQNLSTASASDSLLHTEQ